MGSSGNSGATGAQAPGAGAAPDLMGSSLVTAVGIAVNINSTAAWPTVNTALFQRFAIPVKRAYRYALFQVGTAAGNIQVGVVRLSGTSLLNYTRVMDSGVIACPSAGDIRLDLGSLSLQAGDYAMFVWADSTSLQSSLAGASGGTQSRFRAWSSVASLVSGVTSSGSLSDWAGTRTIGVLIEADV